MAHGFEGFGDFLAGEFAFGKLGDVVQAFIAVQLALAGEADQAHEAVDLFGGKAHGLLWADVSVKTLSASEAE